MFNRIATGSAFGRDLILAGIVAGSTVAGLSSAVAGGCPADKVKAAHAADPVDALRQDRADPAMHDGFDLREGRRGQHVIPPSTTRVWPVMKDAWSDVKK